MQSCDAAGSGTPASTPARARTPGTSATSESIRPSDTARRSATATRTTTPAATRGPTATRARHHNDFYDNALGFTTECSPRPGTPASRRTRSWSRTTTSTRTTSTRTRGLRRRASVPRPGRHRAVDRRRKRQRRPQQPLLRQLAARHDAVRGPDQTVCGPAGVDPAQLAGCNPAAGPVDVLPKPVLRQPDGPDAERHGQAERHGRPDDGDGLLVGPVPRQHRQLLAWQHRQGRHGGQRDEHAALPDPAFRMRRLERGNGRAPAGARAAQLPGRHHVRHKGVSVVHHTLEAIGRPRRRGRRPSSLPRRPARRGWRSAAVEARATMPARARARARAAPPASASARRFAATTAPTGGEAR